MAITPDDIKEIIAGEGFGHEMRVRRILQSYRRESQLQHGGGYRDPQTHKTREFDFRWVFRRYETALSFAIECKNVSVDSPVVISGSNRAKREATHDLVESRTGGLFQTATGQVYLDVAAAGVIRNVAVDESIYPSEGFVGRNILQLKPGKKTGSYTSARDSDLYEKWFQALSSAFDLVTVAMRYANHDQKHLFTLILPIVVLPNNTLWRAHYSEDGELMSDPEKVDECELFVGRPIVPTVELGDFEEPYTFSHLHFFTTDGFTAFLLKATQDHDWRAVAFNQQVIASSRAERLS
ncbi:MAG: hypothetical protein WAO00_08975 [Chthoniobacterales bacterium]